jgi:hypothetical protein
MKKAYHTQYGSVNNTLFVKWRTVIKNFDVAAKRARALR